MSVNTAIRSDEVNNKWYKIIMEGDVLEDLANFFGSKFRLEHQSVSNTISDSNTSGTCTTHLAISLSFVTVAVIESETYRNQT